MYRYAPSEGVARLLRSTVVIVLLLAMVWVTLPLTVANAEKPVVSSKGSSSSYTIQAPEVTPKWTAVVDTVDEGATLAEDGLVFAFSGKKLIAINATTGKVLYRYGSKLKPTVSYQKGIVYGATEDGKVYALDAKAGSTKWLSVSGIASKGNPLPLGDTVYVTKDNQTYALEAATGKVLWKSEEPQADGAGIISEENNGIVYQVFSVQGALSSTQLDAFDKKTGKKLWGHFAQSAPLTIRNGIVYSVADSYQIPDAGDPNRNITINAYNNKTGELKESRVYSWSLSGQPPYSPWSGSTVLNGNDLYIATDSNVVKYDFNAYEKGGKPLKQWVKPSSTEITGSVYSERLFLVDQSSGIVQGLKLSTGRLVGWSTDNPAVQTDIYGNGVFIGQSDGVFHGYNLQTGKPIFTVHTGSRQYGQTLKSGSTLIIQTAGKLTGVTIPKSIL
ncbi:outer membrane protein assembly factor BamB family protein [Cohnella abietis]|uniref:Serine/threonine protein kinase n=1 Tax=Cohnella abietis TaxID=2507935 RepID=A0A3T1CYV8_9BACL|nr:PQQ-binding-like beta-propeller repeat protein [Cohnella abietis]BBI30935.1 serine/threonine protein kinase [Cohnella abietis]